MRPGLGCLLTLYQVIAGSHTAVVEPSQPTLEPPAQATPVIPAVDILIPGPVSTFQYLKCVHSLRQPTEQPMLRLPEARLALRNSVGQEDRRSVYVVRLLHDKEDQVHPRHYGIPASSRSCFLDYADDEGQNTIQGFLEDSLQGCPGAPNSRPVQIFRCLQVQGTNSQSVSWPGWNFQCHCCDHSQDPDAWSQQDHHCRQGTCTCTCTSS